MAEEILGINEIATMAGVTSQAVTNWRARAADFPKPISDLASGPVFRRSQIRAWLRRNNRKLASFEDSSSYYARLKNFRGDSEELAVCITTVADKLQGATSSNKPAMLLGQIQSGKTRGFVGVIAAAFDRGFDIALVVTKGTKTLSAQTVARLSADFKEFIDEDEFLVLDIMNLPGKLTRSELKRKIVVVAKKQKRNLEKLIEFMKTEESLHNRRVLLVDDEADLASVRFIRKRGDPDVNQGAIAGQLDELRTLADNAGVAFLQVTATPYSLYLQPEDYDQANGSNFVFQPKRPAFTELLPIHSGYVGGNHYFADYDASHALARLTVFVADQEQDALRRADQRRISPERALDSPNTAGLRRSITTFVVAVGVRRWQQIESGEKEKKYAMIIHNDTQKSAHSWQNQVIDWIFYAIRNAAEKNPDSLRPLFDEAYNNLEQSVTADGCAMPPRDEAFDVFIDALESDDVVVEKVNSDEDVMALLDSKAELKLRTPYNIFVGGNILDRGITVPNLLAFYYGRNPKQMQADTVLQHSRMYGNREWKDLVVTRFFTSRAVYDRLYIINSVENTLREAFRKGENRNGIAFIQTDPTRRVRSCAPNKVLLSDMVSINPDGMLLPTGFNTRGGSHMTLVQAKLEKLIDPKWRDSGKFASVQPSVVLEIINLIESSLEFDDTEFEWEAMRALIDYYSDAKKGGDGEMLLLVETGRELTKGGSGDKSGLSILGTRLRADILSMSRSKPLLVLLQQEGGKERGWTAHRFWWPVFVAPSDAEPCVFARKAAA
jgi:Z1 domain